jgi:hypothetical protein
MQLNEIIEENTLPTISRRTRISVENLQALIDRDWSRLQKVQALGFISILEREYHIDLSDLKEECRAYYAEHASEHQEAEPLIVTPVEKESSGIFFKTVVVLLLLALAYGAWKYMAHTPAAEQNASISVTAPKGGFFDSVLSTAKGWLGSEKNPATPAPSNTVAAPEEKAAPPLSQGAWAEKNGSEANGTESSQPKRGSSAPKLTIAQAEAAKDTNAEKSVSDEGEEEARIITQVKQEQAKAEKLRQESSMAPRGNGEENLSDVSRMIVAATAGASEETPAVQEPLSPTPPGKAEAAPEKETAAQEAAVQEVSTQASPNPEAENPKSPIKPEPGSVTDALVIFHPKAKVWVGYTELRTMKRTARVSAEDITFDTSKGDYILATGHGKLELKGKNSIKLNDGKRHFFMIAKGSVREISHEEFQRLNKSKVW